MITSERLSTKLSTVNINIIDLSTHNNFSTNTSIMEYFPTFESRTKRRFLLAKAGIEPD